MCWGVRWEGCVLLWGACGWVWGGEALLGDWVGRGRWWAGWVGVVGWGNGVKDGTGGGERRV